MPREPQTQRIVEVPPTRYGSSTTSDVDSHRLSPDLNALRRGARLKKLKLEVDEGDRAHRFESERDGPSGSIEKRKGSRANPPPPFGHQASVGHVVKSEERP